MAEPELGGLLEAAPDAIVAVDADGRIILANAQAERLFGYERARLIGEPVEILVPDAARAVHPHHRSRYTADPLPRPMGAGMELAGRRRDGTEFPAEISLSAIETARGTVVAAAIRDATDRRRVAQAQSQLTQPELMLQRVGFFVWVHARVSPPATASRFCPSRFRRVSRFS